MKSKMETRITSECIDDKCVKGKKNPDLLMYLLHPLFDSSDIKSQPTTKKTDQQVKNEIGAIIKQITASCTFLPMLQEPCAFTILAYTDLQTQIPMEWSESDARLISEGQAEQVKLRSFSTHVHNVDALVAYRRTEDDD